MVDSFRFWFMTFFLSKHMTTHTDLVLQQAHELALERVHLTAAHTFLIAHAVEAHLLVERIGNQAENPHTQGMHVQAQVFHPERGTAVADRNVAEIGQREAVPAAVHFQRVAQPHDRLDLPPRHRAEHFGEMETAGYVEHFLLNLRAYLFVDRAYLLPELHLRRLSGAHLEVTAAKKHHVAFQRWEAPSPDVYRVFDPLRHLLLSKY